MDLGLSEAQEMLQRGARDVLAHECSAAVVRAAEERATGIDGALWKTMAELGWLGMTIPERYGGLGATILDQALLAEELGRALVPGPYAETCVILPQLLLAAGSEQQRQLILPSVVAGRLLAVLALLEAEDEQRTRATQSATSAGDEEGIWRVKPFVAYAPAADVVITPIRPHPFGEIDRVLLFERAAPGLAIEPSPSLTGCALGEVRFEGARPSASHVLGAGQEVLPVLRRALAVGATIAAAYQVGMAAAVLEMTVEYAKNRIAFGQPIGAFQAIQYKLVGMLNDLDGARLATREAAWRFDEGMADAEFASSVAKYLASEGLRSSCFEAHEVHAGVGFMLDYDLQLYYRRAKWWEQFLGHPSEHRDRIAAALLDR
ncbi:MAG: acyl-CoA dehydrogenase [Dehalococcoidia bacterium]|nr:MAG: acyl-CoA dehydrogenase [Dehalococcoidia bacterium]